MSVVLRLLVAAIFIVFLICVLRLVSKDKLLLKYSLLWILLCVVCVICDLFPEIVYFASGILGFISPSNFIFLVSIALLLAISLSLSVAVSRLTIANKNLVQRVALLEKDLECAKSEEATSDNYSEG